MLEVRIYPGRGSMEILSDTTDRNLLPYYTNPWIEITRTRYADAVMRINMARQIDNIFSDVDLRANAFNEIITSMESSIYGKNGPEPTWKRFERELDHPERLTAKRLYQMQKEIVAEARARLPAGSIFHRTVYDDLLELSEIELRRFIPSEYYLPLTFSSGNNYTEEPVMRYAEFLKFLKTTPALSETEFFEKYLRCREWWLDQTLAPQIMQLPYDQRVLGCAARYCCDRLECGSIKEVDLICDWVMRKLRQIQGKL